MKFRELLQAVGDQFNRKDVYYRPKEFRKGAGAMTTRRVSDLRGNSAKWVDDGCRSSSLAGYLVAILLAGGLGLLGGVYWFLHDRASFLLFAKFVYDFLS